MQALDGVVVLCYDLLDYGFLTVRNLEGGSNYINVLMFESYLFQGWVVGLNNVLGFFLCPIGFGDNTRPFVPIKMFLKIFKERDITGYLFHEFLPFFKLLNLLLLGVVGSIGFSFDSVSFKIKFLS